MASLTYIVEFEQRFSRKRNAMEDYVCLAPPDDVVKTKTWHRVASIDPAKIPESAKSGQVSIHMNHIWNIVKPQYDAWKSGEEIPETGTSLRAWAGLERHQLDELLRCGLRSVEDVAQASESLMDKVRVPNARRLPEMARTWLEGREDAMLAEKAAQQAEQIMLLTAKMTEMEEQLANAPKRGPGRPKKEEAA